MWWEWELSNPYALIMCQRDITIETVVLGNGGQSPLDARHRRL
jgi:hypothetical protein